MILSSKPVIYNIYCDIDIIILYYYKNFLQNPSQIFYNVSGESGYDSKF
jgi:hypothetical protein